MDKEKWLGIICMFLNGFVMLTPHRIAMLCANHVVKRFHFPQCTVPLFIYKIHTPMELASLTSTSIAFFISSVNDWFFHSDKFKRIISCITIWIMFLATVISYFLFISGDDYGNFESFYWSVVSITFANGFSSNFGFGVNFNATMYGAGIPASSFVTFLVHNTYKYFYNIYFWDDYDYRLVVVQYWFTAFSLCLTGGLWTWDQVMQMMPPLSLNLSTIGKNLAATPASVEIQIETTSNYTSSNTTVKVFTMVNNPKSGFKRLTHYMPNKDRFTVKKIKKNASTELRDALADDITKTNTKFVHVYHGGTNIDQPLLVCVVKQSGYDYYKKTNPSSSDDQWSQETNIDGEPTKTNNDLLMHLDMLNDWANTQTVIHIEKTDEKGVNTSHQYKTGPNGTTTITVTKDNSTIPGYIAYEHVNSSSSLDNIKFSYKGELLKGIPGNITIAQGKKVWVFYEDGDLDKPKLETPQLLYYQTGATGSEKNHWYGKGKKWIFQNKLKGINASQNLPEKTGANEANHEAIASKLDAMVRQGTFKELVYFDNTDHWSPILMLTFSLGTIYAFYPMISPYSLIDPERAEKIDLWIVVICALPNLGLAILDLELPVIGPVGPGKKWIDGKQDYDPWQPRDLKDVKRNLYNYVWFGGIIYLICLYVFFSTLHFPDGFIGRHVKDNPYVVGFFGVTFNTIQELMESTGFGGGDKQSYDGFVGPINQFSVLLMLITCVCTMFPCDGYLNTSMYHWYI